MASSLGIVNPKKRREIDGVSGSSMVDLKATLFQAEEHAKHARTAGVAAPRSKLVVKAVQNKGVEERNRRDQEAEHRRNNPGASLADKSGQYDAMAMVGYRDEKESFLVDFEQKRWDQQLQDPVGAGRSLGQGNGAEVGRESDTPDAIVRRHHGDGSGAGAVLLALGDQMQTEKERAAELKEKRVAAARKRLLKKK